MRKPAFCLLTCVLIGLFVTVPSASADDGTIYRLVLTNDREVVGEVTELENVYKVKVASGITITIRKSQVREMIRLDEGASAAAERTPRRTAAEITLAEIQEILGSEEIEIKALDYIERVDLMQPFDRDETALREMLRIAGREARVLETDHIVMVYTSSIEKARKLGSRLEAVYKWNVRFIEMMGIPPVRPDSKLEVFFFGTHKEFDGYSTMHGFRELGVLGFFHHVDNRSAFFDMNTWPPVAVPYRRYQDPQTNPQVRRRGLGLIKRYVEFQNLTVIQHEIGHHIHFNIGVFPPWGDVPTWLVEGLTMQFEVPPSRLGASLGATNHQRLREIRQLYGPNCENLPPLRDFMLSDAMWHQGGGASYSIGWALVSYLYKTQRESFAEFMRLMAQREDDRGARMPVTEKLKQIEDIFGEIDDEWVQRFKDYVSGLQLKTSVLPPALGDLP